MISQQLKIMTLALFSLMICQSVSAQQKSTPVKKPATVKKTTPVKPMPGVRVRIKTDKGVMIVRLYDSTPLHRDNFIALVEKGFYDSLMFHRVIPAFMIQGGDPNSKNAAANTMLGMGGGDMQRIPAEFRPGLFHKRGALAAARDGNPQKASSACQFYLVQGKKYSAEELNGMEMQMGRKFSAEERNTYLNQGGTPFLDQNYTVFGEMESGFEVLDAIASAPRNPQDRPLEDIRMYMEIVK
jgi:peptidyl-prolyl cis-trans isomerase B (cyclophilin B)